MFLRFVSAFAVICLLAMSFRAEARDPETMGILKERAENFVECMLKGSVNSIAGEMHPSLRQTYTNEVVRNIFGDLHQRGGRFEEMGEASLSIGRNTSVIAMIPLKYANNSVTARLVFERAGRHSRITEFAVLPYTEPDPDSVWRDPNAAPPAPKPLPSPPYANALVFKAETVELARAGLEPLASTLYMPTIATEASRVPAVILVADANTTGELPMVGTSNPLRDIAEGLATRGVAVLVVVPTMDEVGDTAVADEPGSELDEAPEIIIIEDEDAQPGEMVASDDETEDAEVEAEVEADDTPQSLVESVHRLLASRPQIDDTRVYEIYRNQPLTPIRDFHIPMNTGPDGFALKTFMYLPADSVETGVIKSYRVFQLAVFRTAAKEAEVVDATVNPAMPVERVYTETGPYLIEEITDGESTRYGHVTRAFIEDVAKMVRTARLM